MDTPTLFATLLVADYLPCWGHLLVFLLFVQGGQALLYDIGKTEEERNMLVNSLGRNGNSPSRRS